MMIIGQLMRIIGISGGDVITLSAAFLLVVLYIFFGFALFNRISIRKIFQISSYGINGKQIVFSIVLGLALAFSVTGIVLKLHLLRDADTALGIGIILLAILLTFLNKKWRKTQFYQQLIKRVLIYGGIAIILLAVPKTWLIDAYYFRHPEHAERLKERLIHSEDNPSELKPEENKKFSPYEDQNQ